MNTDKTRREFRELPRIKSSKKLALIREIRVKDFCPCVVQNPCVSVKSVSENLLRFLFWSAACDPQQFGLSEPLRVILERHEV